MQETDPEAVRLHAGDDCEAFSGGTAKEGEESTPVMHPPQRPYSALWASLGLGQCFRVTLTKASGLGQLFVLPTLSSH